MSLTAASEIRPLGLLQCPCYVGTGRSCQLVSYLTEDCLSPSILFTQGFQLERKMEGKLKFNFLLSESPRNGHHENVNQWRFFFLVSWFFFFSSYWSKSLLFLTPFIYVHPYPTFLSLPVYFIGWSRCYQIGENANKSDVLNRFQDKVGIQMKIGWEKECHFFLPRAIERIFL